MKRTTLKQGNPRKIPKQMKGKSAKKNTKREAQRKKPQADSTKPAKEKKKERGVRKKKKRKTKHPKGREVLERLPIGGLCGHRKKSHQKKKRSEKIGVSVTIRPIFMGNKGDSTVHLGQQTKGPGRGKETASGNQSVRVFLVLGNPEKRKRFAGSGGGGRAEKKKVHTWEGRTR